MPRFLFPLLVLFATASEAFGQDYAQEILTHRNLKHQSFVSNPYSPVRPEQVETLTYYLPTAAYKIKARVTLTPEEQPFLLPTYDGTSTPYRRYALLEFEIDGEQHQLHAYQYAKSIETPEYGEGLFVPFLDETNGAETYGGGRYLDLNVTDIRNDSLTIDFNKAYNPYCAYSNGYRCPQPPVENSLSIAILAGEKRFLKPKNDRIVNKESVSGFLDEEKALIQAGDGKMYVLQTPVVEDLATLRRPSTDVDPADSLLNLLADRMLATVQDEEYAGVGIAAPQVGINKNLIWVQRFDKENKPFELYLNPKILWRSQLIRTGAEGCLSIPDLRDDVQRSFAIRLQYWTADGHVLEENIEGFTAVIFQHEVDHLYGILFTDRLDEQAKRNVVPLPELLQLSLPADSPTTP